MGKKRGERRCEIIEYYTVHADIIMDRYKLANFRTKTG